MTILYQLGPCHPNESVLLMNLQYYLFLCLEDRVGYRLDDNGNKQPTSLPEKKKATYRPSQVRLVNNMDEAAHR